VNAAVGALSAGTPKDVVNWATGEVLAHLNETGGTLAAIAFPPRSFTSGITLSRAGPSISGINRSPIEPSVFTTWCSNLAIMAQAAMKKYHIGRGWEATEDLSVYRDATRQADDAAFFMKVRAVAESAFNEDTFKAAIASIRDAGKNDIKATADLPKVVEVVTKKLALPEASSGGILSILAKNGDLTQWGLSSAITQYANDYPDYEGATAFERAGGQLLALPSKDWAAIAEGASA